MNTFKTAAFLLLLGAVLYGGYVLLHRPPAHLAHLEESLTSAWETPKAPDLNLEYGSAAGAPHGSAPRQPNSFGAMTQPPAMSMSTGRTGGDGHGDHHEHQHEGAHAHGETRLEPRDPLAERQSGETGGMMNPRMIAETAEMAQPPTRGSLFPETAEALEQRPAATEETNTVVAASGTSIYRDSASFNQPPNNLVTKESPFPRDRREAEELLRAQKYPEALELLSKWFASPDLKADEAIWLVDVLDGLAGSVIYSRQHWFNERRPYVVARDERLAVIARRFEIPAQLLYNINRPVINDPDLLLPGTELKVVQGPFRAVVELGSQRLTLYLGEMYAGRFDVTFGSDALPRPGDYEVMDKQPGSAYFGGAQTIPVGAENNPYGDWWLSLGNGYAIHEFNPQVEPAGCIRLAPQDAANVFGILSTGSKVSVRP